MVLKNGKVFVNGNFQEYDIEILNGYINRVCGSIEGKEVVDLNGSFVFPGFIDTHIHGAVHVNCSDSVEAMKKICRELPQFGVTSFTPTPIASSVDASVRAVRNIRAAKGCPGSDILGIFLYTPYKNRTLSYYGKPVYPTIEHTMQLADGDLSDVFSILFAPELDKGHVWQDWIQSKGILPVIGFTEGSGEDIRQAVERGAAMTDHFFNGFPILDHHQENSTVACLLEDNLNFQLNCDGIHVVIPYIRLIIKLKGIQHILPISDSSVYVGMPEGEYDFDGMKVYLKDGAVRNADGKLVTGAHSYDENMRTLYECGFSLEEVGTLFTENAANILGIKDRGKIEAGRRADLVIMDDKLNVLQTYVKGEIYFTKVT